MRPLPGAAVLAGATVVLCGLVSCTVAAGPVGSASGKPVYGGTLRVISDAGPGSLDPVPTYNYAGYELERGYARQLVTYPATSPGTAGGTVWARAITLVPDMAAEVPSAANGGVTDHGLVYTYRLRSSVDWNSAPPRQVTAADFVREFKAFCNPGQYPVGNSAYFISAIAGFGRYCSAESSHFSGQASAAVTASAVAAWQDSHSIAGLSAPGPLTLRVTLVQQASDFNNIMALPFTTPFSSIRMVSPKKLMFLPTVPTTLRLFPTDRTFPSNWPRIQTERPALIRSPVTWPSISMSLPAAYTSPSTVPSTSTRSPDR